MSSIALVTGASRGIGRGIALELALAGYQVYITGRNEKTLNLVQTDLESLQKNTSNLKGKIIPKVCDHSIDAQVDKLFSEIPKLDILINNAYSAVEQILEVKSESYFHKTSIDMWDSINHVGLRNHYRCSHHAANLMLKNAENKSISPGFICNISSAGGCMYLFSAAYGVGKEGKDRMMQDMAIDLKRAKGPRDIYCISLWPGAVLTEIIEKTINENKSDTDKDAVRLRNLFSNGESTRYSGRCLAALLTKINNKSYMKKLNGKVIQTGDIGREFGLTDVSGRVILGNFSIKGILLMGGFNRAAAFVPSWLQIPRWAMVIKNFGSRFR